MKITTVIGARPQFIKASFLSRHFPEQGVTERLLHTGQHYDQNMSEVFFNELKIPKPACNLDVNGKSHGAMTGQMLELIESDLQQNVPDAVLVYGDTDSTLAGALAATKLHIPVIHVEAGLRSFDRKMPEEVNRVLTDHVSKLLFCPTQSAVNNLRSEGIESGVQLVGDVMQHVLSSLSPLAKNRSIILQELGLHDGKYFLATLHRAENTDDSNRFLSLMNTLGSLETQVVFPLHPRTKKVMERLGVYDDLSRKMTFIEPQPYLDMIALIGSSSMVLTDSGGLQKEAVWMNRPCVTLRETTEWVETVNSGWNKLVGVKPDDIFSAVSSFELNGSPAVPFDSNSISAKDWIAAIKSV